ncbi:metallophosphoesterase family protein [uncultured Pseudokineococcus sp.]|uniref:metallophosphoesterase family protein n=1 Tax=uncultured Pseudokineococcus sp. TaxID=1642928 RepID=UPI0026395FA3|nr:metallophosphoesterase [uncultured Pseudokineococcus sp.]
MDDEHPGTTPPGGERAPRHRPWRAGRGRALAAWSALVVALGLVAAVYGVTSASAEASLGPHVAEYSVTTDGEVAVDLGPLGALVIDSPLPLRLGVDVVVEEIPREVTDIGVSSTSTVDLLGDDLQRYLQLFSAPQATVDVVVRALVLDAAQRWLTAWALLVLVAVLGRLALGPARRAELAALGHRHRAVLAGVLALSLVAAVVVAGFRPQAQRDAASRQASPVFDGTPLEGARITGRLASVVDLVGGYVTDFVDQNTEFYDRVTADLERAWAQRSRQDPAVLPASGSSRSTSSESSDGTASSDVIASPGSTATPTGTTAPSGPAAAAGDPQATSTAGATPGPTTTARERVPADDVVTALVVSDLHCNVGMAGPVARLAELADVDLVLDAGDTVMNGTAVEQTCVSAFAGALPDVPVVVADGNHDSPTTADQERAAGWTVLDGEVVDVAGLKILGVPDPRSTQLLSGSSAPEGASAEESARTLVEEACAADDVDLLLVHDPSIGAPALEAGCAPAQVSGHYHVRTDPEQVGRGIRYISSSTAGAVHDQLTVGPLNGTAEMTLLRFDAGTGDVLSWRVVSATANAEVTVGPWRAWPAISSTPTPVDEADPTLLPEGDAADGPDAPPDAPGQPALDDDGRSTTGDGGAAPVPTPGGTPSVTSDGAAGGAAGAPTSAPTAGG